MAKLRKETCAVQTGTLFGNRVISGAVDLGLALIYMDANVRHRPTTFMRNPRFNKAVFKFKL
jgi:hypothetical protein